MSIIDTFNSAKISNFATLESNIDLLIDQILPDDAVEKIYVNWRSDMPVPLDFGGGEKGITVPMLLAACEGSYYKLASYFDLPRSESKDYLDLCNSHTGDEVYK